MPDKDRIKQLLGEPQLRLQLQLPFPQKAYQCSSDRCPALSVLTLFAASLDSSLMFRTRSSAPLSGSGSRVLLRAFSALLHDVHEACTFIQ
jgi:hypothetical protein